MIHLRPAAERGFADHGWLQARHSFSFADYYDPAEMGWGVLRVINEDRVAPGTGFGMHGHRDMEILTYILDGTLEHRDSMGNRGQIRRGEIQRMSAGSGVMHSEINPSPDTETHLLQIWLLPAAPGGAPGYEQQALDPARLSGQLCLLAAPVGENVAGAAQIGQDARVYASQLAPGQRLSATLAPGRLGYVQVVRGTVAINGLACRGGDGAKIAGETALSFVAGDEACEFLFFDLPPA